MSPHAPHRLHRVAALVAIAAVFTTTQSQAAASADSGPVVHVTNLPTSEAAATLTWSSAGSGTMTVHATGADAAARHLQLWREWTCPDATGTARLATTQLREGAAMVRRASTTIRPIQTTCAKPTPAPQVLIRITRSGSSAGVTVPVTTGSKGSWSNTSAPFRSYDTASYDGETCHATGNGTWIVSDAFTVTGGVYELLRASTTGNANPDITPQLADTPIGYAGGPDTVTFTVRNSYPYDPSGQAVAYRVCPNQGEAYVDVDWQFPDGTYAGEWELTHPWPTTIPICS